jgi:DNA modification methylase
MNFTKLEMGYDTQKNDFIKPNLIKTKMERTPNTKTNCTYGIFIKTYTNENDMVLDNTMGSGTTNLACIKLNRKSIGIEKEKQYYDVAVRRASEYCH